MTIESIANEQEITKRAVYKHLANIKNILSTK